MSGPTLHDLLGGLTLELSDRLEWIVLTWDLACIKGGSNDYYRLLMTDDCLISTGGVRTPQVFATSAPQLGQRDALLFYSDDNLQESLRLTEARTSDPAQYERLGVDDPARPGSTGGCGTVAI